MGGVTSSLSSGMTKQQALRIAIRALRAQANAWEQGTSVSVRGRTEKERLLEAAQILGSLEIKEQDR